MHRQILLTFAALALAAALGACERHSFEKTQVLHRAHGAHDHGHGHDHGHAEEGEAAHHPGEAEDSSPAAEAPAKGAARDLGVD